MPTFLDASIEFSSGIPVYRQIVNLIYSEIGAGNLREGDRLPTIKRVTERLKVNPNTVAKAYRELDLKGIIQSRRGDGSFVSALMDKAPPMTDAQKRAKLDEIFGRIVAEGRSCGITEEEILAHMAERMRENG
jgi:GntR family transcriptional regulator